MEMDKDELLNVKEFAKYAGGISPWTVTAWLSHGKLVRTKIGGRTMIRRSELQRVLVEGGKSLGRPRPKKEAPQQVEENRA